MKKLVLCTVAVLCIAVSIFGGYYYFTTNDSPYDREKERIEIEQDEEEGATDPDRAAQWRADAWRDENGEVSTYGLVNAVAQRDAYLAAHDPTDGFGDNGTARLKWVPVGPDNIGGRTKSLIIDPDNPRIVWAASAGGGVWKSYDGGETWNAMNGGLQNFAINCLALDTGGPSRVKALWAGTGERFAGPPLSGGGLFKSVDGGVSWRRIAQSFDNQWQYVDSITVTHRLNETTHLDETVLLAGVQNDPETHNPDRGIMRSTDGGNVWTKVNVYPGYSVRTAISLAFSPSVPGMVIAGVVGDNSHNRVMWSDNYGAEGSWHTALRPSLVPPSEPGPAAPEFLTQNQDGQAYLMYNKMNPAIVYAKHGAVISKSIDGGKNYPIALDFLGATPSNGYLHLFWVSPFEDVALSGFIHLFRRTNAGTFQTIATGSCVRTPGCVWEEPHVDMQFAVGHPGYDGISNKRVYVTTDGGIFRTDDILTATASSPNPSPSPVSTAYGWHSLNNRYQTTQFYSGNGDANSGIVFGGTQDDGSPAVNLNTHYSAVMTGGDGGGSEVADSNCYGQINTGLHRVRFCGSPTAVDDDITSGILDYRYNAVPFVAPMIVNPQDLDTMFLGGGSVWRSDNIRDEIPSWLEIKPNPAESPTGTPLQTPTSTPTPSQKLYRITAAALAPSDPQILWVGEDYNAFAPVPADIGGLYKTEHATEEIPIHWDRFDNDGETPLPNRQILSIMIDKVDPRKVYVGFAGAKEENLWRTTDEGGSWTDITGDDVACTISPSLHGLPCVPITGIARDPNNANKIYVGTDIGIYVSPDITDSPISWLPVTNGPANVKISNLTFLKGSNKLLAATYGRGLWVADLGPITNPKHAINDFDGDGRSDLAIIRQDSAHKDWHLQGSSYGYRSQEFGNRDDQVAAADYDGDGKTDVAVYRGSEQKFYCMRSSDNTLAVTVIGQTNSGAQQASADFDGDDLADEAVFDPYTGLWTVEQSTEGHLDFYWGETDDDPIAADFNNDGQADFGVFHEENGMITLSYYSDGVANEKQFGLQGDIPVPGEYDGDGKVDIAVWRPDDDGEGNGCWYITYGADSYEEYDAIPWGESGDVPVPGDYDGDGKVDIAVWRPSTGMWHMLQSSNGYYSERFGADGDAPVGVKALYASRPGNHSFTRAPAYAEPRRREESPKNANKKERSKKY